MLSNGLKNQEAQELIIIEGGNGGDSNHQESIKSDEVVYTKDIQCDQKQVNIHQAVINQDCIYLMPEKKKRCHAVFNVNSETNEMSILTKEALVIHKLKNVDVINISTIKDIPVALMLNEDDTKYNDLIRLACIPKYQKKRCSGCKCSEIYNERNVVVIYLLINKAITEDLMSDVYQVPELNELSAKNRNRKLLLFVNPMSGTKSSVKIWNRVEPIFKLAKIDFEVVYTERFNHAYDVVMELDYKKYDGIITCSGDGIIHEIMNAMFHRSDSKEFRDKIVIGALPGGSANGFCSALNEYSNEADQPETSAYIIIKGNQTEMDLQEMELISKKTKVYSFLSLTWGIVADIDLESEV